MKNHLNPVPYGKSKFGHCGLPEAYGGLIKT